MATSWPQSPSVQKSPMSSKSQLFWYTRNGDVASVKRLLDSDPELISAHDYDGRTALHVAASFDRLDVARLLLTNNAPVNAQDRWGNSVSYSLFILILCLFFYPFSAQIRRS